MWVDDIFSTGDDTSELTRMREALFARFQLKSLGRLTFALGMAFKWRNGTCFLSQTAYVDNIITRFGFTNANPLSLPMQKGLKPTAGSDKDKSVDETSYRSMIGSLLYLGLTTRPDITYAVCALARYVSNPKKMHLTVVKRIIKYVLRTRDYGLLIRRRVYPSGSNDSPYLVQLARHTDASFNDDPDTSRSTLVYVICINGNPIAWKSKLSPTVPQSTMESELIALHLGAREVVWCRYLLEEILHIKLPPTPIHCDNAPCVDSVTSAKVTDHSKHICPKFYLVRDLIQNHEISMVRTLSANQLADILTKAVDLSTLIRHRDTLQIGMDHGQ